MHHVYAFARSFCRQQLRGHSVVVAVVAGGCLASVTKCGAVQWGRRESVAYGSQPTSERLGLGPALPGVSFESGKNSESGSREWLTYVVDACFVGRVYYSRLEGGGREKV